MSKPMNSSWINSAWKTTEITFNTRLLKAQTPPPLVLRSFLIIKYLLKGSRRPSDISHVSHVSVTKILE